MVERLKRSRKSFVGNYILGTVSLIVLLFVYIVFKISMLLVYVSLIPIVLLFLEPEFAIIYKTYFISSDNISEVRGIINKKKETIPWGLAAYTAMKKTVMGRILGYGDIIVTSASGVENKITLRGIKNPEKILEDIEEKIRKNRRF